MDDNDPCRYWVSSESDGGVEYVVDLCEWELGPGPDGVMEFNGVCGLTKERIHGCRDFIYRCEPALKKPINKGRVFRCKHIRCAREHAFTLLLPYMSRNRPNLHEDLTP